MMKRICFLLIIMFSVQAMNAQLISHFNPIIADMIADPSITKINGIYYCYATTDGYNKGLQTSGPPVVWISKDLVHWTFKGFVMPSAVGQLYWAPSKTIEKNGKYYLYPTINTNIHVAVADHPEGPFKLANGSDSFGVEGGGKPLLNFKSQRGTKGIDAEVFVDDDGQAYMYWAQRGAAKMNDDMISLDSTIVVIPTKRAGYSEGPIFFKRNGIYYYLYTLEGHENYKYAYVYSKVSPLGPFVFPEDDIIAKTDRGENIYGPGHGSVFESDGQFYFSYLEFGNGGTNRQVFIDSMHFNADGTIHPVKLTHQGVYDSRQYSYDKLNLRISNATASSILPSLKVRPIKDSSIRRIERYDASNVFDGNNATRWMADSSTDTKPSIILDLGEIKKVKSLELFFVQPTSQHECQVEYSTDGIQWRTYKKGDSTEIKSPYIVTKHIKSRYFHITITKGIPGLWEVKLK